MLLGLGGISFADQLLVDRRRPGLPRGPVHLHTPTGHPITRPPEYELRPDDTLGTDELMHQMEIAAF